MFDVVFKRKPRENIKVCVNVSRTSYRQATDRLPTHYQQSADCRPTVGRQVAYISGKTCRPSVGRLSADSRPTDGRQTANCRPTVGRLSADCRPTVGRLSAVCRPTGFLGSSSSQLPTKSITIKNGKADMWQVMVFTTSTSLLSIVR